MIVEVIIAFCATIAFSGLFNVPKEQYAYCGASGAVGWLVYKILSYNSSIVLSTLVATLVLTSMMAKNAHTVHPQLFVDMQFQHRKGACRPNFTGQYMGSCKT